MTSVPLITPVERPDIIVPDASPLIHLAQAGLLHLLHEVGRAVILVDVVVDEITRAPAKPGAETLHAWIGAGQQPGSNAPIRVETTETGRAIALARQVEPEFRMRHGGENAIIDWLVEELQGTDAAAIVLYENGRVPRVGDGPSDRRRHRRCYHQGVLGTGGTPGADHVGQQCLAEAGRHGSDGEPAGCRHGSTPAGATHDARGWLRTGPRVGVAFIPGALNADLSSLTIVMPAQAGIHDFGPHRFAQEVVDARLRGHDGYGSVKVSASGRWC